MSVLVPLVLSVEQQFEKPLLLKISFNIPNIKQMNLKYVFSSYYYVRMQNSLLWSRCSDVWFGETEVLPHLGFQHVFIKTQLFFQDFGPAGLSRIRMWLTTREPTRSLGCLEEYVAQHNTKRETPSSRLKLKEQHGGYFYIVHPQVQLQQQVSHSDLVLTLILMTGGFY